MSGILTLRAGAVEVALAPAAGGSLAALRFAGEALLRSVPDGSADPLDMASFPLVPYANRIAQGRFRFDGQDIQLPLNFGDHPHSIHGLGWTSRWAVEEATQDTALLVHEHDGTIWPWAYRAEQRVAVTGDAVEISLSVRNLSDRPMPVGLGFHPYFCADDDTRLQFTAERLWLVTPDLLPEREVPANALGDWSAGDLVPGNSLIDNAYRGWSGSATVTRGSGTQLTVTAQGASWLHLYRPPQERFFCLEPVSHMPDAVNHGGMETLAPRGEKSLSMRIAIAKSDEPLSDRDKIA